MNAAQTDGRPWVDSWLKVIASGHLDSYTTRDSNSWRTKRNRFILARMVQVHRLKSFAIYLIRSSHDKLNLFWSQWAPRWVFCERYWCVRIWRLLSDLFGIPNSTVGILWALLRWRKGQLRVKIMCDQKKQLLDLGAFVKVWQIWDSFEIECWLPSNAMSGSINGLQNFIQIVLYL